MSYHPDLDKVEKYFKTYQLPETENLATPFPPTQKYSFKKDGFYYQIKKEALEYFKENNLSMKADWLHIFMFLFNVSFILFSCFKMITEYNFLYAFLHAAVNRWAYRLGTILIGLWAPPVWDVQHVVAHHIYTNEWPYDSDSAFPLKSLFVNQRRLWFHKYQHIYLWVVYAFTIPLVMLNSLKDIVTQKQVLFRIRYHNQNDVMEAYGCAVSSVIYLTLPFCFLPLTKALAITLASSVTSSLFFSLQFVVNHEVDGIIETSPESQYNESNPKPESSRMLPPAEPTEAIDWGEYQMANSLTFAPRRWWALELAGGLNTQVEHHLFPGVHYHHYNKMGDIIRKVAKERGLVYHSRPNLLGALMAHYRLLKNPPVSCRTGKSEKKQK
jgi:fatty acid desaturase